MAIFSNSILTKPLPTGTALLCIWFLFNKAFNGNPQGQVALEKAHWQMLRACLQQTLKRETLK